MCPVLPPELYPEALRAIAKWRDAPCASVQCPVCNNLGVKIEDRSSRPFAEWYEFDCAACGLNATIHVPLPGPAL